MHWQKTYVFLLVISVSLVIYLTIRSEIEFKAMISDKIGGFIMSNLCFLQKITILVLGISLVGCITTAPTKTDGEQVNLDRIQQNDHSLTCSDISTQISDIDKILHKYQANTAGIATNAVATQVGTQVASDIATITAYQIAPQGAQYLPQIMAIGKQYMTGLQQNDQQIASKAGIRKNYLVGLYHQKTCDRKNSIVRNAQVHDTQIYLNKLGYHCGSPDGIMGRKTREAVKSYQKDNGIPINGQVTADLVKKLLQSVASKAEY